MNNILLGIVVDDEVYKMYSTKRYDMKTNNPNGSGTPLKTIAYMASSKEYENNAPEVWEEANQIIDKVKKELQEFYDISTGKKSAAKHDSFTGYLDDMSNVYISAMSKYDTLADKKEKAIANWNEARKSNSSDDELVLAKAAYIEAMNEFNTAYKELLEETDRAADEVRTNLKKHTEEFYTINPDKVEPGTMDLLMSGILNAHDINVLAERNRSNVTMLRMIGRSAEDLDTLLAHKIKSIGTGEHEMQILNNVAEWGKRCLNEDRKIASVNRQHYDRIFADICTEMENLYANPIL